MIHHLQPSMQPAQMQHAATKLVPPLNWYYNTSQTRSHKQNHKSQNQRKKNKELKQKCHHLRGRIQRELIARHPWLALSASIISAFRFKLVPKEPKLSVPCPCQTSWHWFLYKRKLQKLMRTIYAFSCSATLGVKHEPPC